jgi:SHS2 domain-containing protein
VTRPRHRLLPHTADLCVEVRADDLPSLLAGAAGALFSLLTDRRRVRRKERKMLAVPAAPPDEQLYLLLRQALLLLSTERFLARSAGATMDAGTVNVVLEGEAADPSRHEVYREIKAVTWHALSVGRDAEGWTARFIVDV